MYNNYNYLFELNYNNEIYYFDIYLNTYEDFNRLNENDTINKISKLYIKNLPNIKNQIFLEYKNLTNILFII